MMLVESIGRLVVAEMGLTDIIALISCIVTCTVIVVGAVWKLQKFVRDNTVSPKDCATSIALLDAKREQVRDCVEADLKIVTTQVGIVGKCIEDLKVNLEKRHDDLKKDVGEGFRAVNDRMVCFEKKLVLMNSDKRKRRR